jgi:hypothetical protein
MMGNEFTCAACCGTFSKVWTDEEARAEAGDLFPGDNVDDMVVVCDTCWREMMGLPPEVAEHENV